MKKRILFVDDEPLVLMGLQRMLRGMREEWEMEFVAGGAQALERMAQAPFDVVVTDMRMPGMNGAELLDEVMRRHPKTVRIVLSGHADKDLILKCVSSTHQYLSKPCDAASIKTTVRRACGLENEEQNEKVKQLVAGMERLPSLPSLYVQIVEELNSPAATIEHIGEIISQDVAMTAQFLRLVNSAYFGLSRAVASPTEAAIYLGVDTIKSLVLSLHTFSKFEDVKGRGFKLDALLHHSLRTAGRARGIAQMEDASQKISNECFVGGMLHDIGELLLAANYPREYQQVTQLIDEEGDSHCAAEKKIFGVNHASVGGYLLGLWGLPVTVVEAIALHHCPNRTGNPVFGALTAVHAANVFENERAGCPGPNAENDLDDSYLDRLGLTHRVAAWRETGQAAESKEAPAFA
ncbi:MAG: response regulator [Verrucomicrobiota bacterium]|jgi:HD-like signal output (HDOD) protein